MNGAVLLSTTDAQVTDLQRAVNEARAGSETIRINRASLRNLLLDHYALCERVGEDKLEVPR